MGPGNSENKISGLRTKLSSTNCETTAAATAEMPMVHPAFDVFIDAKQPIAIMHMSPCKLGGRSEIKRDNREEHKKREYTNIIIISKPLRNKRDSQTY